MKERKNRIRRLIEEGDFRKNFTPGAENNLRAAEKFSMGSIQISSMIKERSRKSRGFLFFPEGTLIHHLLEQMVVVLLLVGHVRSPKEIVAPARAARQGRISTKLSAYLKSTKFGRQNPITERWNSDERLVLWRAVWADAANRHLERIGHEERIEHRSHAERGLLERSMVHEGVVARAMQKKDIRPVKEQETDNQAQQVYGERYSPLLMLDSQKAVSQTLDEDTERQTVQQTQITNGFHIKNKSEEQER